MPVSSIKDPGVMLPSGQSSSSPALPPSSSPCWDSLAPDIQTAHHSTGDHVLQGTASLPLFQD